jgi:ferredoxin-nitrite reductase
MNLRLDLLVLVGAAELIRTSSALVPPGSPIAFVALSPSRTTTPGRSATRTTVIRSVAMTTDEAQTKVIAKPTGTFFLPPETVERAKKGNPVEKLKLQKDGTSAFVDVYEYARQIREGTLSWEEIERNDLESVGLSDLRIQCVWPAIR